MVDDVDLLTVEFAYDRLHARTAGTDAGADGIDFGIGGGNGDLGAIARLAGKSFDLHRAIRDFGDFEFEEPADKFRTAAAENQLGAARRRFDREQKTAD